MRRREFLAFSLPFLGGLSSRYVWGAEEHLAEKYLGEDWRLPRNSTVEIWPVALGLDLSKALVAVADWSIPSTSRLVIRLPDGEHALLAPVVLRNQDGDRVAIIGNLVQPEKCRIVWEKREDAFYVAMGRCIGLIDGVTVEHSRPTARGLGSAFLADAGGVIRCGSNVRVHGFYYGFQARHGGAILCSGTQSFNAGDANYFAFSGGHIHAEKTRAESAVDREKGLGGGFVAEYGGTINAHGAIARHNALAGFVALSNGVIRAYDSITEMNGRAGYYSDTGGMIVAHRGVARLNCQVGVMRGAGVGVEGKPLRQADNFFNELYCHK